MSIMRIGRRVASRLWGIERAELTSCMRWRCIPSVHDGALLVWLMVIPVNDWIGLGLDEGVWLL